MGARTDLKDSLSRHAHDAAAVPDAVLDTARRKLDAGRDVLTDVASERIDDLREEAGDAARVVRRRARRMRRRARRQAHAARGRWRTAAVALAALVAAGVAYVTGRERIGGAARAGAMRMRRASHDGASHSGSSHAGG